MSGYRRKLRLSDGQADTQVTRQTDMHTDNDHFIGSCVYRGQKYEEFCYKLIIQTLSILKNASIYP